MRTLAWGIVLLSLILFVPLMCMSAEEDSNASSEPKYGTVPDRVQPATDAQVDAINAQLTMGTTAREGYRIESEKHEKAHWVSARLEAEGMGDRAVGVWLCSGSANDPDLCFPASSYSEEFSCVGSVKDTDAWSMYMLESTVDLRTYTEDHLPPPPLAR